MSVPRSDVEKAWVDWLRAAGIAAATRVPEQHVDAMVRVSRSGGGRKNIVMDEPLMLFEVWHHDAYQASRIAAQVAERVEVPDGTMIAAGVKVTRVETTGPVEFPDPNSELKRYQFTATMLVRRVFT